jgi:hypothetical protein
MFHLKFNVSLVAWPFKHGTAEIGVHKKSKEISTQA